MVRVTNLSKYYTRRKTGFFEKPGVIKAVDNISFTIEKGKTLGLVGESGSGKTTVARSMLRLIPSGSGSVTVDGTDVFSLEKKELRMFRKQMQLVFQDPYDSLNPRMTVGNIVQEPLKVHGGMSVSEREERVNEIFQLVGLPLSAASRYPHEFSGGQRQRIGIARALSLYPSFMVLDEPVSALDVSIQGQVLNLLKDIQEKLSVTSLFIAHDLAVVKHMSDYIAVMYLGRIVEYGPAKEVYGEPLHPYTQSLIASVPSLTSTKGSFKSLEGEIPSPENPPRGCHFHPRCPRAEAVCRETYPEFSGDGNRSVACHLY
jgi:oligopeptide transport system ATP-binding protein